MNAKEIRARMKTERCFVEFQANDGRLLMGELMAKSAGVPKGHFDVVVNWSTWYVTPDVITRFVDAKTAMDSWAA